MATKTCTAGKQIALSGARTPATVEVQNDATHVSGNPSCEPVMYRTEIPPSSRPEDPEYHYRVKRGVESNDIHGVLGMSPDGDIQARFGFQDTLYHRKVLRRRDDQYEVLYRIYLVGSIYYSDDGVLLVDLLSSPCPIRYSREEIRNRDLDPETVDRVETVTASELVEHLDDPEGCWSHISPEGFDLDESALDNGTTWTTTEPIAPESNREPVDSVSELTFEHFAGKGSRTAINAFLTGGEDGLVDHQLGEITNGWKAAFVARHAQTGEIVAVAVVDNHPNPNLFAEAEELYLSRLAAHPTRPANTASWMLARICEWGRENGYARVTANAGVGTNTGTCYKAAGFEIDQERTGWAEGDGWTNRDGRGERRDGQLWYRRKWVRVLE